MSSAERRQRRKRDARRLWAIGALSVVLAVPTVNAIAPNSALRLDAEVGDQAAILADGGYLVRTGDERLLRRHILLNTDRPIDVLAIGSSRSNPISVDAVGTDRFVNVSASFGTFFDVAALYAILDEADRWPERLIIAPDAWSLNADIQHQAWRSYGADVDRGLALLGLDDALSFATTGLDDRLADLGAAARALTAPADFQGHALSMAGRALRDPLNVLRIDHQARPATVEDRQAIWGPDLAYWYSCVAPEAVEREVDTFMTERQQPPIAMVTDGWRENDPRLLELFDRLIAAFQERGVEVTVFIPPIHPRALAGVEDDARGPLWLAADAAFRDIAASRDVHVIGGLDATALGLSEDAFCSDAIHLRPDVMVRVFDAAGWERPQ